jgi:hypothetical protein
MQKASRYWVAVNVMNKELWAANKQWSLGLAVRRAANTPYHKDIKHYEMEQTDRDMVRLNGYSKTMMIPV